mgnify:CR=1 FL=1
MSFNLQSLRQKSQTRVFSEIRKSVGANVSASKLIRENNQQRLFESQRADTEPFDIFLSHCSKDADVVLGLLEKLNEFGYVVYVDWIDDPQLDRSNVTKATANVLRERMNQSKCLFYATTINSTQSKWMPWELGYIDGRKDKSAILPIFESESSSTQNYKGQEYLGVYPYCIEATTKNTNVNKLWICESEDIYVLFDDWLKGKKPYKHNDG